MGQTTQGLFRFTIEDRVSISNYGDVHNFHRKFGLPHPKIPQLLDEDTQAFRMKFMAEELDEFDKAWNHNDLATAADSLIDLVYVVMGTAVMMGLPWQALWDAVQYANMRKVRAESADDEKSVRKHRLDVVKPPGWQPPNIKAVLDKYTDLAMKNEGTNTLNGHEQLWATEGLKIGDPNDQ